MVMDPIHHSNYYAMFHCGEHNGGVEGGKTTCT